MSGQESAIEPLQVAECPVIGWICPYGVFEGASDHGLWISQGGLRQGQKVPKLALDPRGCWLAESPLAHPSTLFKTIVLEIVMSKIKVRPDRGGTDFHHLLEVGSCADWVRVVEKPPPRHQK